MKYSAVVAKNNKVSHNLSKTYNLVFKANYVLFILNHLICCWAQNVSCVRKGKTVQNTASQISCIQKSPEGLRKLDQHVTAIKRERNKIAHLQPRNGVSARLTSIMLDDIFMNSLNNKYKSSLNEIEKAVKGYEYVKNLKIE